MTPHLSKLLSGWIIAAIPVAFLLGMLTWSGCSAKANTEIVAQKNTAPTSQPVTVAGQVNNAPTTQRAQDQLGAVNVQKGDTINSERTLEIAAGTIGAALLALWKWINSSSKVAMHEATEVTKQVQVQADGQVQLTKAQADLVRAALGRAA